jgi:hypothetical protein
MKRRVTKRIFVLAIVVLVGMLAVTAALAASRVTNGDFETGTLSGWTASDNGAGGWSANDGTFLAGCAGLDGLDGPAAGSFDGLFDMSGPASGLLSQEVTVPTGGRLSFSMEYENDNGAWDITPGNEFDVLSPNQWISIDVLKHGADPASFDPADILATAFRETSGTADPAQPWHTVALDLSAFAGQSVIVRFASADTEDCLPFEIDQVALTSGAAAPPVSRMAYCSVAGDTWPDGTSIAAGTFLNLEQNQPSTDSNYKGAQPAIFVEGKGLTCDPPPAGDTLQGTYDGPETADGVYPYYAP